MFTKPVKGKEFFGRDDVLDLLYKRVKALVSGYRQNIAITGHMMTGKTSILQHFLECLKGTSILPVYVEVGEKSFALFASKFMATLLYSYLKAEGKSPAEDLDALIKECEAIIPRTVDSIKHIRLDISKRRYNAAYRSLLEITSIVKEETKRPCIVILDEFHNLENFKIKNPFLSLGKIIMLQKSTMYIVSSSQRSTINKILVERLSLLFGNFEIVEVAGFDNKTAKDFFKQKIAPLDVSEYYCDYILNLTDRNPFYLDIISKCLVSQAKKQNLVRINIALIKDVMCSVMMEPTGVINQHFTSQINFILDKKNRKIYLDILLALSSGANKLKEIATFTNSNERNLSEKLEELADSDLVYRCGMFYKLHDRFFEFWLKNVALKKEKSLVDIIDRTEDFKTTVENNVESYLIEYNKGPIERIQDLFNNFNGELVELDKRMHKLPKFVRIETLKFGDDKNYVACKTQSKYWVVKIKQEETEENDVLDLVSQKAVGKNEASRKIIISLKGIDGNALLLAKEKRIWVWDVEKLNFILGLYKKHRIMA